MSDPVATWSFWSVAIGGGILGAIIGALVQSCSAYLLEGLRERKELVDLARSWAKKGKPDIFRHADLRGADLRGASLMGTDFSYADPRQADLSDANLHSSNLLFRPKVITWP